ncbi:hypothetical protein K431DRAFT_252620 [Polychaeton citri CBS 116435]|uniref:Calcineurin-like phosphoesterase domain-containing protein n=1 Tax=Polychaeton citri CBS 116435 TaxID=1314669 RepID=A0A9P4Q5I8_9PEZI|nr:hypothetical protein K431DRAFT_252620 [Polychaeton citri CBS 116435]
MQPDAQNASTLPRSQLAWGQVNFLHTTDTHGWLEGHLKEQNYGADWGDYVSFVKGMRHKAQRLGVDLLLVDTGDLHDGAGLSDATSLNGEISNPIFQNIDYDLLTIGNHELYVSAVAYETFANFSKHYGERYLTSNVQIFNPTTEAYEYVGHQYRYFKTDHGLNIMAFGVLFNFTGNSNASKVIPAQQMVQQQWFRDAITTSEPIDLFVLIGHNPVRPTASTSTLHIVYDAIRAANPNTPIQIFGGHTHIRDFSIYDDKTTALESGRYCETLGWLSMSGFKSKRHWGLQNPRGVPNPTTKAIVVSTTSSTASAASTASSLSAGLSAGRKSSDFRYFRRYLDWNRLTFEYHAAGSQIRAHGKARPFDNTKGLSVTEDITEARKELNLTGLYGCAPQTWCVSCQPFGAEGNIYTLLERALEATVINKTRKDIPRIIIQNTGSVRFDLVKGPFTYDDSFIVSPFQDAFEYLAAIPYELATKVLAGLNAGAYLRRRSLSPSDFNFYNPGLPQQDTCVDPPLEPASSTKRSVLGHIVRRQSYGLKPGYATADDFGSDGDDTEHIEIPHYSQPNAFQANASFPANGSTPVTVDLIFLDFIAESVVDVLNENGGSYSVNQVNYYLPPTFTTNTYLSQYAQTAPDWQADVPNCPVGQGVGYD